MVQQRPEQRIDAGDHRHAPFAKLANESGYVAWVGDEHVESALLHEQQAITGETEHVVQGQRSDHHRPGPALECPSRMRRSAANWPPCCDGSTSRPWRRRWYRPCTEGTRCRRRRPDAAAVRAVRRAPEPREIARAPGRLYGGTRCRMRRTTKLTTVRLGKPARSPTPVITTCSMAVSSITSASTWA